MDSYSLMDSIIIGHGFWAIINTVDDLLSESE